MSDKKITNKTDKDKEDEDVEDDKRWYEMDEEVESKCIKEENTNEMICKNKKMKDEPTVDKLLGEKRKIEEKKAKLISDVFHLDDNALALLLEQQTKQNKSESTSLDFLGQSSRTTEINTTKNPNLSSSTHADSSDQVNENKNHVKKSKEKKDAPKK